MLPGILLQALHRRYVRNSVDGVSKGDLMIRAFTAIFVLVAAASQTSPVPQNVIVAFETEKGTIEMEVDAQAVHVSADIPVLGRLLGGSVTTRLKEIVQRTFQPKLPEGNANTP